MHSLVTGSSGLLGGCLVERLRARGASVRLMDLEAPRYAQGDAELVIADASDETAVVEAARGCDVIYHLAAAQRMKPQFSGWSEEQIFRRNLAAARHVLTAAERGGVRKVVFTSSSGIYGVPRTLPCAEDHPPAPLGEYGRSKLEAERLCREAIDRGLDVTVLRPMSLFGPGMSGIFVMLFEWIRKGQPVFMLGDGRNRVQASSAWDVADACLRAAGSPSARGGFFNVASDPDTVPTVRQEVEALVAHAGTGSRIVPIPASLLRSAARTLGLFGLSPIVREHYVLADRDFILDIRAAKQALGWEPRYDNERMLTEAYDWYVTADASYRPASHPVLRVLDAVTSLRPHAR
jgi:nucleoside-diphosphate-sugar epimerase